MHPGLGYRFPYINSILLVLATTKKKKKKEKKTFRSQGRHFFIPYICKRQILFLKLNLYVYHIYNIYMYIYTNDIM